MLFSEKDLISDLNRESEPSTIPPRITSFSEFRQFIKLFKGSRSNQAITLAKVFHPIQDSSVRSLAQSELPNGELTSPCEVYGTPVNGAVCVELPLWGRAISTELHFVECLQSCSSFEL